jgi:hypothetical protein
VRKRSGVQNWKVNLGNRNRSSEQNQNRKRRRGCPLTLGKQLVSVVITSYGLHYTYIQLRTLTSSSRVYRARRMRVRTSRGDPTRLDRTPSYRAESSRAEAPFIPHSYSLPTRVSNRLTSQKPRRRISQNRIGGSRRDYREPAAYMQLPPCIRDLFTLCLGP